MEEIFAGIRDVIATLLVAAAAVAISPRSNWQNNKTKHYRRKVVIAVAVSYMRGYLSNAAISIIRRGQRVASPPKRKVSPSKKVRFSVVQVRTHEVIIGDHPSCGDKMPLSLGWKHSDTEVTAIDAFEVQKGKQERRKLERLSTAEKTERLLAMADSSKSAGFKQRKRMAGLKRLRWILSRPIRRDR